jgi:hypothetical protein
MNRLLVLRQEYRSHGRQRVWIGSAIAARAIIPIAPVVWRVGVGRDASIVLPRHSAAGQYLVAITRDQNGNGVAAESLAVRGLCEKRKQAPAQQSKLSFAAVPKQAHDRLIGLRRDVLRGENLEARRDSDAESLGQTLLLCPVLVSTAHD